MILLVEEIPLTTWDVWNLVNNGINYQSQLVSRIWAINSIGYCLFLCLIECTCLNSVLLFVNDGDSHLLISYPLEFNKSNLISIYCQMATKLLKYYPSTKLLKGRSFFKDFWLAFGGGSFHCIIFSGFLCVWLVPVGLRLYTLLYCTYFFDMIFPDGRCPEFHTPKILLTRPSDKISISWQFFVPFLGWLSDPFKG